MAFVGLASLAVKGSFAKLGKEFSKVAGKSFDKIVVKAGKKFYKEIGKGISGALKSGLNFLTTIPFIPQFVDFTRSLMDLGTSPALQLLSELLGGLGAIIGVVIEPLQPFIDLLSIFAMALSAALVPLTAGIYEGLIPSFDLIIASIPEMAQAITDFMVENGPAFVTAMTDIGMSILETIPKILELIPTIAELTLRFFELAPTLIDLIPSLLDLALKFIDITFTLIESGLLASLLNLSHAIVGLLIALEPLVPFLVWMIDVVSAILWFIPGQGDLATGVPRDFGNSYGGSPPGGWNEGIGRGSGYHQYGGMASYTGYHWLEAGEDVSPVGVGGGTGAIEIHIHGNVFGINDLEDKIFDELERRKRLGLI